MVGFGGGGGGEGENIGGQLFSIVVKGGSLTFLGFALRGESLKI